MSDAEQRERIEQLLSALRDENEALRSHAVASLGQMGMEALPQLIGMLEDEDAVIREATTSAIVRIGPEAVEPLIEALRVGQIDPEDVLDASGNLPGAVVRDSFKSRKPTGDLVNYANLWQNLWNDEYLEGHQAIGRWLHDHIPMPGALFKQVVPMWLANNGFVNDSLRLGGRPAPLSNISMPVLGVIGVRDDIAHEVSTSALGDVLTGAQVELMRVDAGHASLFSGRKAVKVVMPGVFDWIAGHSEEISDVAS